jgi:mRNA interferase HigB
MYTVLGHEVERLMPETFKLMESIYGNDKRTAKDGAIGERSLGQKERSYGEGDRSDGGTPSGKRSEPPAASSSRGEPATVAERPKNEVVQPAETRVGRHTDPGAVYIGRKFGAHEASEFQNPFVIGKDGTRKEVVQMYNEYIKSRPDLLAKAKELAGKILGCYCAPELCHGDVLKSIADGKHRDKNQKGRDKPGLFIDCLAANAIALTQPLPQRPQPQPVPGGRPVRRTPSTRCRRRGSRISGCAGMLVPRNLALHQSLIGTSIGNMRIIAISALRDYWLKRPDAERALRAWIGEVQAAEWKSPADVKAQFRNASVLPGRRVIFNIKGNDHRLVVAVAYVMGMVYIKFIGTHEEYDTINAQTVERTLKEKRP